MNALVLLLTLTSVIVLHSGDRISVEGAVREENGVVTFRSGGLLYSLPKMEVARIEQPKELAETPIPASSEARKPRRLRLTEEERKRLIERLEQNHEGTPAPPDQSVKLPPAQTKEEKAEAKRTEQGWRSQARMAEEAIVRASEELALLETRERELQQKIHSLLSLGFKPHQFTYDTTMLARTQEQIPYARLEVTRAERAYSQLREDARKEGVPPGWLR